MSPYSVHGNEILLDGDPRAYTLKIHDLPSSEKPRERLLAYGPQVLSTAHLIAIVLGTGTRSEDVLAMSARMVREYGERGLASRIDAKAFATDMQIPLGKAMQIVAALELGRRFFKQGQVGVASIRTARDVFEYTADMRTLPKEHLRGLYLNAHHRVIHDEVVSIGTVNTNMLHPREIFRPALEYAAVAVILVHNHPSGTVEPSDADIAITRQLIDAGKLLGIDVLDHIIVTKDAFMSIPAHYQSV